MPKLIIHSAVPQLNNSSNLINGSVDSTLKSFSGFIKVLVDRLKEFGWETLSSCSTSIHKVDAILFIDHPKLNDPVYIEAFASTVKKFLFVWESPTMNELNHQSQFTKKFDHVFTYDKDVVDATTVNYTFDTKNIQSIEYSKRTIFASIVCSNRYSLDVNDLYSYRRDLIDFFSDRCPQFHLYGKGWYKFIPPKNVFFKILNRLDIGNFLGVKPPSSYKGQVDDKNSVLIKSKFVFCIENCRNDRYYISEKLLEALEYGCVPLYLGCDQVDKLIPTGCFIDLRGFECFDDLLEFMLNFSESDFNKFSRLLVSFVEEGKLDDYDLNVSANRLATGITELFTH